MLQESEGRVRAVNPRSTGEKTSEVYRKHSKELTLESEADELLRCADLQIRTDHVLTTEFVDYDKEKNILTTKRIHGDELFLTLWNPTSLLGKIRGKRLTDSAQLCSRLLEVGKWLSMYHQTSSQSANNTESAVTWLQRSLCSKVKQISDNNLLPISKLEEIEQYCSKEINNLKDSRYLINNKIEFCRIHGDFIVYNMLIDKQNDFHVIDFGDTRIAANIDDVARFYSNLWAISNTNRQRKSLFLAAANGFLASYGLPEDIVETPYFKAMMAYNFLIHLCGEHRMRQLKLISFTSGLELRQITKAGLKWIDSEIL